MSRKRKNNKGFTLAEITISIAVLSFGIVLVYSAFSMMITSTYNISARFTAVYLAQEGVEIIRNIRDNNFISKVNNPNFSWSAGLVDSPCNTGCMADYKTESYSELLPYNNAFLGLNSDGFYTYDYGAIPTIFKRKITITPLQGTKDTLHVDVTVTWTYNEKSFSFETSEDLYNWR